MYLDAKLSSSKQQRGDKEGLIRTSPKQTTFAFSVSEFDSVLAPGSFSGGEFQSGNTSIGDNALETTSYVVNEPEVISNPSTSDFGGGDDHSADSFYNIESARPTNRIYTKNYARYMQDIGEDLSMSIAQHRQSVAPLQIDPMPSRPYTSQYPGSFSGPLSSPGGYNRSRSFTGPSSHSRAPARGPYTSGLHHDPFLQSQYSSYSYDQYQAPTPMSSYGGGDDAYGYSPMLRGGSMNVVSPAMSGVGSTWPLQPSPAFQQQGSRSAPKRNLIPPDGYVYQVQFKRAHRNFILAPSAPRDIIPGDFVKVEADRGEDMGIVLAKCPVDSFEEVIPTAGYRGRGFSSGQGERKYLYRLATAEERSSLTEKVADEEHTLETVRQKVMERRLPMRVLDAEYQFDRHKLTFFFEAEQRIDFRDLVSELFSQYKTRIWMQQVDTTNLSLQDAGTELAKATGFLPADRDEESTITMRSSSGSDHELRAQFPGLDTQPFNQYGSRSGGGGSNQDRHFGGSSVFGSGGTWRF